MSLITKNTEIRSDSEGVASIAQASEFLGGISHWTLRKWIQQDRLITIKIGGRRMIPMTELRRVAERGL